MTDAPLPAVEVSHLGLCVSDLGASMRFYCDGLGFSSGITFDLDDTMLPGLDAALEVAGPVEVTSQFIERDGLRIELLSYTSPAVTGTPSATRGQLGLTHLAFRTPDVDGTASRLVEHGGTVIESTRTSPGVDLVFIADPDGNRVELLQA